MSTLKSSDAADKQMSLVFKENVQENMNVLEEDNRKRRVLQKTVETNKHETGCFQHLHSARP